MWPPKTTRCSPFLVDCQAGAEIGTGKGSTDLHPDLSRASTDLKCFLLTACPPATTGTSLLSVLSMTVPQAWPNLAVIKGSISVQALPPFSTNLRTIFVICSPFALVMTRPPVSKMASADSLMEQCPPVGCGNFGPGIDNPPPLRDNNSVVSSRVPLLSTPPKIQSNLPSRRLMLLAENFLAVINVANGCSLSNL